MPEMESYITREQKLEQYISLRPEQIIEISRNEKLNSELLLVLKSRSFAYSIFHLHLSKGVSEEPKEKEVRTLYNLLRWLDTAEDGYLKQKEKQLAIDKIPIIISQVARRNHGESIDDIIEGELFKEVNKMIHKGAVDEEERVFVEHFGHGPVLEDLRDFRTETKDAILYGVGKMAFGMKHHLQEGTKTIADLREYCYYVAGSIGETLNRLVYIKDKKRLDDTGAKTLGEILQITNIAKNIFEDNQREQIYIPQELHPGTSWEDLMKRRGKKAGQLRAQALEGLLSIGESGFPASFDYINLIPPSLNSFRLLCVMSTVIAKETWRRMRDAGADKVFKGAKEAIKISSDTYHRIKEFSKNIVALDNGQRAIEWGKQYRDYPNEFPFHKEEEYSMWSRYWLE